MEAVWDVLKSLFRKDPVLELLDNLIKEHEQLCRTKTHPHLLKRMTQFYRDFDKKTSKIDDILAKRPEYSPFLMSLSYLEDCYGIACGKSIDRYHLAHQRFLGIYMEIHGVKPKRDILTFVDDFTNNLKKTRKVYLELKS